MRLRSRIAALAWAVFSALISIPGSYAQVTTATFYGIVRDFSSAAIPGATVTLTHEGTATITAKTAAMIVIGRRGPAVGNRASSQRARAAPPRQKKARIASPCTTFLSAGCLYSLSITAAVDC